MSYKNALAGLPLGGGKAVIDMPRGAYDRTALFEAFGRAVAELRGTYVTAEDVGTSTDDMLAVRNATSHVAGLPAVRHCAGRRSLALDSDGGVPVDRGDARAAARPSARTRDDRRAGARRRGLRALSPARRCGRTADRQ